MNYRAWRKMWTYASMYGASAKKVREMMEAKYPLKYDFDFAEAERRLAADMLNPVEEHGPEETVYLRYYLPLDWREATEAFACTRQVQLVDIAKAAIDRYITATMNMYRILKEARNGTQAP